MSALTDRIRERARELGFTQVGFAPAEVPPTAPALEAWLEQGMAGEMRYMAKDPTRRMDPRAYWPDARAIIALSVRYAPRESDPAAGPLEGRVARYARGDDYHDVLKARLHLLGRFVTEEVPGTRYIAVVDTSALLERAHAVRAGLGWFGKNSMLLDRRHGSYTVLGFLLVDLELPSDTPVTDHCGSCTRCLDACPTAAIVAPGVVDARRCISYLTIELRGSMPLELRDRLSGWVFGCDVCQEVCPWVRHADIRPAQASGGTTARALPAHASDVDKAGARVGKVHRSQPTGDAPVQHVSAMLRPPDPQEAPGLLEPRPGRALVELASLIREDRDVFSQRWRGSPIKRTKRAGMARNAVVLLGSSADREGAIALLEQAMGDPDPVVRGHAAWALGRQGGRRARARLERSLEQESDADAKAEIERALEHLLAR